MSTARTGYLLSYYLNKQTMGLTPTLSGNKLVSMSTL